MMRNERVIFMSLSQCRAELLTRPGWPQEKRPGGGEWLMIAPGCETKQSSRIATMGFITGQSAMTN